MLRTEENRKVTNEILSESGIQATFNESLILNMNMAISLLIDISRSLAVIADNLEEQTSAFRELDENLKEGE
jgi:hypothetical protein